MELTERIEKLYIEPMMSIGNLGDGIEHGFRRLAWSDEETQMHELISGIADSYGLRPKIDSVGNLFITAGEDMFSEPSVLIGSHLDSINGGGTYDGVLGVIVGLEVLKYIKESKENVFPNVVVGAFRGEKSTQYGQALMGSLASVGKLNPELLNLEGKINPITLKDAIESQGYNTGMIRKCTSTINIENITTYLEAHIEQSGYLLEKDLDIGIVTGLRAPLRYKIKIIGEAAHSGGQPMELRKDADLLGSQIKVAINDFLDWYSHGEDLVWSSTMTGTNSKLHSTAKVPEEYNIFMDIRSISDDMLNSVDLLVNKLVKAHVEKKRMNYTLEVASRGTPIPKLDSKIMNYTVQACETLELKSEEMISGPGHDLAVFANLGIPSGLLFVPGNGKSHSVDERAELFEIVNGRNVMLHTLKSMYADDFIFALANMATRLL